MDDLAIILQYNITVAMTCFISIWFTFAGSSITNVFAESIRCQSLPFFCFGTGDNDKILGTSKNDRIDGLGGKDVIRGNSGDDIIFGFFGDDILIGNTGDDDINGGIDNDLLLGGEGDDKLAGDSESDRIFGESGNDRIFHGPDFVLSNGDGHKDFVDCGPGNDEAWINVSNDGDEAKNCETVHSG